MINEEAEQVLNVLDIFATAHLNESKARVSADEVQAAVEILQAEITHGNEAEANATEVSVDSEAVAESDIPF